MLLFEGVFLILNSPCTIPDVVTTDVPDDDTIDKAAFAAAAFVVIFPFICPLLTLPFIS